MSILSKFRRKKAKDANAPIVARLEEILRDVNPCQIKVVGGKATCYAGTPCCRGCQFLTASGCSVNSIACKFYFCPSVWKTIPESIRKELVELGQKYTGELRLRHTGFKIPMKPPFVYNVHPSEAAFHLS